MEKIWYYQLEDIQQGPVSIEEINEKISSGQLSVNALVWKEGMDQWKPLNTVSEFTQISGPKKTSKKKKAIIAVAVIAALGLVIFASLGLVAYFIARSRGIIRDPVETMSYTAEGVRFEMSLAPAKVFPSGADDEGEGEVENPFWISQTPVTYELWYNVKMWAEDNGYTFSNRGRAGNKGVRGGEPGDEGQYPVTSINWYDAVIFSNALSEICGLDPVYTYDAQIYRDARDRDAGDNLTVQLVKGFRLPEMDEWELAARYKGSDKSHGAIEYPEGSGVYWTPGNYASGATGPYTDEQASKAAAWYNENSDLDGEGVSAQPVGQKPRRGNNLGLYDMSGNVFEWQGFVPSGDIRSAGGCHHRDAEHLQVGFRNPSRVQVARSNYTNMGIRLVIPEIEGEYIDDKIIQKTPVPVDYAVYDMVEVEWGGSWYDGQILDIQGDEYYITYLRYSEDDNEWVDENRLRPWEEARIIESFDHIGIFVEEGTPEDMLVLPETVKVTLDNGLEVRLPVVWDTSGYDPDTPGEYPITGTFALLPDYLSDPGDIDLSANLRVRTQDIHSSYLKSGEQTGVDGLLFYADRDYGTRGYYFGTSSDIDLSHLIVEKDDQFDMLVVFDYSFYPIQWVFNDLTIALVVDRDKTFDPESSRHFFLYDDVKDDFVLNIRLEGVTARNIMERVVDVGGSGYASEAENFTELLDDMGWIDMEFEDIAAIAQSPHEVTFASSLAVFGAYIRILDELVLLSGDLNATGVAVPGQAAFIQNPLQPGLDQYSFLDRVLDALREAGEKASTVFSILSYLERISSDYYGGEGIEGPKTSMLLCKGATTVPMVCHEFYMPNVPGNITRCVNVCLTSLACFTDICHPKVFGVEDALSIRRLD